MAKRKSSSSEKVWNSVGDLLEVTTLFKVDINFTSLNFEGDSRFSYDIDVTTPININEEAYNFLCSVAVKKSQADNDELNIVIAAQYGCLVRLGNQDKDELIAASKVYAGTVIWNQFTSLFALIAQQTRVEFPPLPPYPDEIEVMEESKYDELVGGPRD